MTKNHFIGLEKLMIEVQQCFNKSWFDNITVLLGRINILNDVQLQYYISDKCVLSFFVLQRLTLQNDIDLRHATKVSYNEQVKEKEKAKLQEQQERSERGLLLFLKTCSKLSISVH